MSLMDKLNDFFGQDSSRADDYRDFDRRVRENPGDISDEEAARRYREMMSNADDNFDDGGEGERGFGNLSSDERRQVAQRYREANDDKGRSFEGYNRDLNDDEASSPRELNRMTREAARKDPDLLDSIFGNKGPLSSTAGRAVLAGLAAAAARKYLK